MSFHTLVDHYRQSHWQLCTALYRARQLCEEMEAECRSLWQLRPQEHTLEKRCQDGDVVVERIAYHAAEFHRTRLQQNAENWLEWQKQSVQDCSTRRFVAESNRLKVELHVHELVQAVSPAAGGGGGGGGPGGGTGGGEEPGMMVNHQVLNELRTCLDVLFHFETLADEQSALVRTQYSRYIARDDAAARVGQPEQETQSFRSHVRKWLLICVDHLYKFGTLMEHRYVMAQTVRCTGVTSWASTLQFHTGTRHT